MPDLDCRAAGQDCVPALAALNAALLEQQRVPVRLEQAELEHRMMGYFADGYQAVLFTWDGEPVGYCLYRLYPKYAHVRHFYLDQTASRKLRISDAFDLFRDRKLGDYASVRMDIPETARESIGIWESIGFRPRSRRLELQTATKRKTRKSCGAVIYRRILRRPYYLVVQHGNGGHWGFPKGHVAANETEMDTARREIAEETGLQVGFRIGFYERIYYLTPKARRKEVVYFLSRVRRPRVRPQAGEIMAVRWLPYRKARVQITYESARLVLDRAHAFVTEVNE